MDDRLWTIVVAAGSGTRFGGSKQFETLVERTGERVVDRSVRTARRASAGVVLVVPTPMVDREAGVHDGLSVVSGGSTRSASVRAGLAQVPDDAELVAVHDAARPFATAELYERLVGAIDAGADGAVPGVAVVDTIKVVDQDGAVVDTPDRAMLRAVQTPQIFRAELLRRAHRGDPDGSDDGVLVEAVGGRVVVVDGESEAFKITVPSDLDRARDITGGPS